MAEHSQSMSEADQGAALRRVGAALAAIGADSERLRRLGAAVEARDRDLYGALLEDLRAAGYPLQPEDCPIVTFSAAVLVPVGPTVCTWVVGPLAGQIYEEPETLTVTGGVEIATPPWWTYMLEKLGVIECTQLLTRRWEGIHGALCGGGPEIATASSEAAR